MDRHMILSSQPYARVTEDLVRAKAQRIEDVVEGPDNAGVALGQYLVVRDDLDDNRWCRLLASCPADTRETQLQAVWAGLTFGALAAD